MNIKCLLCGNPDVMVLYDNLEKVYKVDYYGVHKQLSLRKCAACKQVFVYPQLEYGELKNYFTGDYLSFAVRGGEKNLLRKIQDFLKAKTLEQFFGYGARSWWRFLLYPFSIPLAHYPPKKEGGKILDIGCGSGNYLDQVQRWGWDVYGVDPSEVAVKITKERGLKNVQKADGTKLPFEDNFFDVVSIFHVFEHVPNPYEILPEIKRVLKPGGSFIVGVPNFSSFGSKLYGKYWAGLSFPLHYFLYTKKTISKVLNKEGFSVKSVHYANFLSDVMVSSPENALSPHFDYKLPNILKRVMGVVFIFANVADYFIGNLISHIFHLGAQITIVSKNDK